MTRLGLVRCCARCTDRLLPLTRALFTLREAAVVTCVAVAEADIATEAIVLLVGTNGTAFVEPIFKRALVRIIIGMDPFFHNPLIDTFAIFRLMYHFCIGTSYILFMLFIFSDFASLLWL